MRRISSIGTATVAVLAALAMALAVTPALAHDGDWGDRRSDEHGWDGDHAQGDRRDHAQGDRRDRAGWGDRDRRWNRDSDHHDRWGDFRGRPSREKERRVTAVDFKRSDRADKPRHFSWARACDRIENISVEQLVARLPALLSSDNVIFFVKKNDDGTTTAVVCHSPSEAAKEKAA